MSITAFDHHHHSSAGVHVHASVDHLATDFSDASRLSVQLDPVLMQRIGASPDDIVRITTDRGRSVLGRLGPADAADAGILRLDRFARQALKAHLNESVEIERIEPSDATKVELMPAVDVSMAHDLLPHIRRVLAANRTPVVKGAVLYVSFPDTNAGTTYEVHAVSGGAGIVGADTTIELLFADSHLPDGAYDVTFDDVGGLGKEVGLVRELVQLPLKFPHVYRHLGINPPRGVLLYGPPGSGKTHLARALANEVEARFYYINGPDVIGTYAGETEANLRRIFSEATHHAPSIIFIDELDAMAPKRGETGAHSDTRTVAQLLSFMDGLKRVDSVIIIGTTNRIDAIDVAFRRPGRFDREIYIGPPPAAGRREILDIHTREMPLAEDGLAFLDEIARQTHGFVGADIMELCRNAGLNALRRNVGETRDHRAALKLPVEQIRVDRSDFEAALAQARPSALRETLISTPEIGWRDIGGLEHVKSRLRDLVEQRLANPQELVAARISTQTGVLLHGPSGTGKTLLAQALACECGVNFIVVDGPELFTKWLGESEEGVRHLFKVARQVSPAVIFFDQLDSIAPIRGRHAGSITADRVVSQLLTELDGVEQLVGVVVVGATNRIDLVDPAILRPGRFGFHIEVPLPEEADRREIARIHLAGATPAEEGDLDDAARYLAAATPGFSGAVLHQICEEAKRHALARRAPFSLDDMRAALEHHDRSHMREGHDHG
jgi:transitional endoplasmic reticulum ATPase